METKRMRAAIAGGGSMGLLLAARLSAAGCETTVWTRSEEQARTLEKQGITLLDGNGERLGNFPVRAVSIGQAAANRESLVVLLALKQTGLTEEFLRELREAAGERAEIVSFCNGIGHLERLTATLPGSSQLAAVTTEGALRTGPSEVMHTGKGQIWMGQAPIFKGSSTEYVKMPTEDRLKDIENLFQTAGFSIFMSNKMSERILRKLLINSVINPLTALLRVRNGELLESEARLALMRALFEETLPILQANGLSSGDGLWEEVVDVCVRTARNESSMLQDVRNGRLTEIEAINGAVSRLAADMGASAPWNEKLTALVGAING
ncbi:ketopantoate reductase family protein [Cohnella sp. AR92]|uniref:ketopantoate reductase family protein n=1 Tax=Cohnella sp. AR92 TaxID=648716 RepID=UPI000F8EDEB6|nr:ketopantoate reductase family protein [Cohnella sp. AR92]RUS48451.1 ketopantoate reductase family protein [Cohnella sp. AR92]